MGISSIFCSTCLARERPYDLLPGDCHHILCRRFMTEIKFEFFNKKKVQYKFLFQFLYGNPQIIYSNNKTTMFAQKQQLQHRVHVSITNNNSNCSTGLPDLIIRAIIFHLEIQIISHDGVPLVSQT